MAAMTMAAANMLPNNSMNFTENQHGNAVLETLYHQREQNAFCDVILHVQGQEFEAHRCVLAACSKYFQARFKQERVAKEQVEIPSCGGHEIFKCLLDYIYTGNVVIDKHNVSELVRLSNHLSVLKLRGHCSEYLERYLDVTNCLSVLDMAAKYQMGELLRTAAAFVRHHIDEVLRQQEAMELPHSKVETIINDKELDLSPERQLTFILDWVRHSVSTRENELRQLLLSAPLQLVERGRLQLLLQGHGLLAESERCLFATLQSLADAGVRLPAYEHLYTQIEEKYMQDLVVDNEALMSMAINTAIEDLVGTEATVFDGLHRLQQQAAVSGQNPAPIEMFSLSGIEDALGGGGGGEALPAAEQETARDLRCHGAAEPRHAGRHQELPPAALMRYQEYGDAAGEQLPPPASVAVSSAHDKYAELAAAEAEPRYSEHARAAPRAAGRYRNVGDCHEMAGAYGGGSLMSAGDAQYVVVLKRPGDGDLEKLEPPVSGGDDRRLELGQALGAQCMVPWYADTATVSSSGSGGGEPAYCEQQVTLAQCRFERDVESAPAEPRYPPLATRSGRDGSCYQVGEGRGAYDPAPYGCEAAPLEPLVVVPPSEQTTSLLYSDGRRAELLAKLELSPLQEQCDKQERRFEDHARFEDQERFDGQGRFEEQGRFDDQGRFEGQGRFEESGRFEDGSGRFADEAGRFSGDQERLGEMSQGRFMEPEQGRYAETAGDRFGDVQQARQVDQARFEQLEQARFEQAELARFEQTELARPSESDQVFVYQSDPLRLEPVPVPSPPPPQPLPMPAKKRKLDPGLAEELRTIHERNQQSLQEQLRAPPEPEYAAAPVGDHELPAIQEELRGATDPEPRPDAERPHGAAGQEDPSSATPPAGEPNVNHSPKKKRLRRQAPPPPPDREEELGPANTTDLTPLLAVAPAPPSPVPAPPPPQQSPPPPARPEQHACSRCQSVFTLKSALLKHIAAKHRPTDQKKKTFMCNVCETTCDKKALYVKHMLTHFEGPPFTCSICFREFPVFSVFLRHRREHGENKPYRCPDCNLSFWKKCNLDHHMRVHTGEKPFQCTICKVTFSLRTTLKQHMNKHSSEKKYTCDECDFSTKYANHLITHKKIHAGDLHRCSHAGCQYTTPKRSHLREHLQSHAKRRSHHCPLCHSTFNVKTHLSRHMRTHDESKQFRCTLCDYTVHRSDRFKSHMATHARPEPKGHRPNAKRVKTQPPPPPPPLPEPAMEVELPSGTPIAAEWDVF